MSSDGAVTSYARSRRYWPERDRRSNGTGRDGGRRYRVAEATAASEGDAMSSGASASTLSRCLMDLVSSWPASNGPPVKKLSATV